MEKIVDDSRNNSLLASESFQNELKEEKEKLIACFGSKQIYVKPIKNGYFSDSLNPWFSVITYKGEIIIGWRKRVIVIDWAKSDVSMLTRYVFVDEDTTKEDRMIHAWGYEKATQYIKTLLSM